jgi:tetratricopeptide (TPR) repeat protein
MKTNRMILKVVIPLWMGSASVTSAWAQSRVADSVKDAQYACAMPPAAQAAAKAAELGAAQWDKNKLACSSDIASSLAQGVPADPAAQVQALLAATRYIDHVNTLASLDLYGVHQPEWSARLQHAAAQGKAIEARLAALPVEDANVLAARALYKLTWPVKIAETKEQIAESGAAMQLLDKAVALDPKALEGNALWLLGRLYYDMPEFAGGDPDKGIKLLETAVNNTPQNASLLRYLAYVQLQERNLPLAKQQLTAMLALPVDTANLQTFADEFKSASDLAARMPDPALAKQLSERREQLFKSQPQLLRRLGSAANMHGGVDPITGKDY